MFLLNRDGIKNQNLKHNTFNNVYYEKYKIHLPFIQFKYINFLDTAQILGKL